MANNILHYKTILFRYDSFRPDTCSIGMLAINFENDKVYLKLELDDPRVYGLFPKMSRYWFVSWMREFKKTLVENVKTSMTSHNSIEEFLQNFEHTVISKTCPEEPKIIFHDWRTHLIREDGESFEKLCNNLHNTIVVGI